MKNSALNFLLLSLATLSSVWAGGIFAADFGGSSTSLQTNALDLKPLTSALPADSAFTLSALIELPDTIVLMWEIEEGYYLYRKSLSFSETISSRTEPALIPDGIHITDEFFGEVEVYYDRLLVRIPFHSEGSSDIELQLSYQGCAEIGYCYPMQQKIVALEIP
jgi:thiol:disulfide interchange protein